MFGSMFISCRMCMMLKTLRLCRSGQSPSAQLWAIGAQHRGLRIARAAWKDVTIAVPSMGDSITEGTIASIEKKEGASLLAVATRVMTKADYCSAMCHMWLLGWGNHLSTTDLPP